MPITLTPTGFVVTYSRWKAAAFSVFAFVFAILMILAGADLYFSILDGTGLDWLEIERRPAWFWGGLLIIGGVAMVFIGFANVLNVVSSRAAITMDDIGVASVTPIGRRAIAWGDIGSVAMINKTVLLYPAEPARGKPVPLQTYLTSVSSDELRLAMAQHRPELFLDTE